MSPSQSQNKCHDFTEEASPWVAVGSDMSGLVTVEV